jgi:hypothetical protein
VLGGTSRMPAKKTAPTNPAPTATGGSRPRRRSRNSASFLVVLLQLIGFSYFGRVFLTLLVAAILGLINILLSHNQFDLFFQLCGIEIILAAITFWLRLILRRES